MEFLFEHTQSIILIMEIIGTIAFASSGALTAFQQDMDIFGVNVLAVVTSVGGGIIRDLIIGNTPPVTFQKPIYAVTAMITCNLLFALFYCLGKRMDARFMEAYERIMNILDAIGLGIFTVVGVSAGMHTIFENNFFLLIFLGVITGVGGGVIRDMLAIQKPYILVKHVYACASILGATLCVALWPLGDVIAMFAGALLVVVIRVLATTFKWNLPHLRTSILHNNQ